jgi:GT2 family glycosyltransferase
MMNAFSNSKLSYEIFVVDNNSTEGNADMIIKNFPFVELIVNDKNVGFPKANNQAIKLSNGEYILLLNPDTLINEDSIPEMLKVMETDPTIGIVSPKLYNLEKEEILVIGEFPSIGSMFMRFCLPRFIFHSKIKNFISKTKAYNYFGKDVRTYFSTPKLEIPTDVKHVSGACMLLRRELIEDIGLLDEKFFIYLEDTDYSKRAIDNGWRVVYAPLSTIIHVGGASSGGDFTPLSYCRRVHSANYYFIKHHNILSVVIVKIILLFSLIIHFPEFFYFLIKDRSNNSIRILTYSYTKALKSLFQ